MPQYRFPSSDLITFSKITLLLAACIILVTGCNVGVTVPAVPPSALSLLETPPLIGDESIIRDPAPVTSRLVLDSSSVEGWLAPPEGTLRFPVELWEGINFSILMGAVADVPVNPGELVLIVEFIPDSGTEKHTLFTSSPNQSYEVTQKWILLDVPMGTYAPGRGEFRLTCTGPVFENGSADVLWGEPVIYHPTERKHKNVLLIGVDTLRRDALTPYGASEVITPNLQEFSQNAVTFEQARSQSSWTLTSFASIVTGTLPSMAGVSVFTGHIPENQTTLGELIRPEGFATGTSCANPWLGNDDSGFHQGMDSLWFVESAPPQESVRNAINFIQRSKDRDWFLFLHFMDPHAPWTPSQESRELITDPAYYGEFLTRFTLVKKWKDATETPPETDVAHVHDLYLSEVHDLDTALGELFEYLETNGFLEDTLIIFSADHGEEFFEHNGFEHGHTQYDELVHMPLIVRGDGFTPGTRIETNVGNSDIFPTILQYLDIPIPDGLIGSPMQDVVNGSIDNSRIIMGEDNTRGPHRKYALQWPFKCILDAVNGDMQLFNLENDPGETVNVLESNHSIANLLVGRMVQEMLPQQTILCLWFVSSPIEESRRYTGSVRVVGGVSSFQPYATEDADVYSLVGDTFTFDLVSNPSGPSYRIDKHFLLFPSPGATVIEAQVLVDGEISEDHFFPLLIDVPETSGFASIRIDEFPVGPNIPSDISEWPGFHIWCMREVSMEERMQNMDPETLEQLRALGYIGN